MQYGPWMQIKPFLKDYYSKTPGVKEFNMHWGLDEKEYPDVIKITVIITDEELFNADQTCEKLLKNSTMQDDLIKVFKEYDIKVIFEYIIKLEDG